ncbi:hypothetical protein BABINDRAFT_161912 [Babjeviella inositovora NRRL Y-12698]|uniref:Major facilitator superfamily (MFS) profile domain-containing protein n=1 Tax=Babjeviella inositovora NRRL Y-12698 TaxID=984486 RepID=A0A1E3QPD1_9ASCO|nr:uncharacterized protein BABINDRAFT_161912 [Babjeviella inositovora NRRL Y-12698]ODQ79521.1 hypothetical protein BABINDRAFT_161912 [Babjeviella inositovora NRRL Y-12698]
MMHQPNDSSPRSVSIDEKPYQSNSNSISSRNSITSILSGVSRNARDIYPGLADEAINRKRIQTRSSIIDTLLERASRMVSRTELSDEEKQVCADDAEDDEEGLPIKNNGTEFASLDPELVTWDGPDDPEHPRNWPLWRKWKVTVLVSLYTLVSPYSSTVISLGVDTIAHEFHIERTYMKALIVSISVLAWAVGPLFVGPLSEMYGRKVMLNYSILFLLAFNFGCAFSQNTAQMLVFRFFAGLGGGTPLCLGAGVLGDCFDNNDRNVAMGIFSLGPVLGPSLAPIFAGFIVENTNWRWLFYVCCMLNGVVAIFGLIFYEETYAPTLLKWKAARLRKQHNNPNLKCIYEIADGETVAGRFYINLTRPIKLLFLHPMVFGLGSFMAFVYGFMYLMIVTVPALWITVYGFNLGIAGLLFVPMAIGYLTGVLFWTWMCDRVYKKLVANNGGVAKPEFRLPMLLYSGAIIPVGLLWYGWSAQKKLHWMMPSVGTGMFAFGLVAVMLSIQNYLVHMNPQFAASSVSAASLFRSLAGFGFPLFATQMYAKLDYGWGNTLCAFLALALGIPFPVFVVTYGERLRLWANKRFEKDIAERQQKNLKRLQAQNEEKQQRG